MTKTKKIISKIAIFSLILMNIATINTSTAATDITNIGFNSEQNLNTSLDGNYITFTSPTNLSGNGAKIVVRIPNSMVISSYEAGDVEFTNLTTSTNLQGGTISYDTNTKEISYTFDNDDTISQNDQIKVLFKNNGSTSFVKTPSNDNQSGQYGFFVHLAENNGTVKATGIAILSVNNKVSITAVVQEAISMTIDDTTINLNVDPTVNDGKDYSQKTVLTVGTNANNYVIRAKLEGVENQNASQLDGLQTNGVIPSGDANNSENKFSYVAYENEVTKTQNDLQSVTARSFSNSLSNLLNTSGNNIGGNPGNNQKFTIYYLLNVDYNTPADTYGGIITYVVTPSF